MIDPKYFLEALKEAGIDFVCGVPDSILKELLLVLQLEGRSSVEAGNLAHVIVASEGRGNCFGCWLSDGQRQACSCVYAKLWIG
jgi:sulfopyruvate decarboxylase TPP-binding subunit